MEIVTIVGALGGLVAMGIMFYREVRRRAALEIKLHEMGNLKGFYELLTKEYADLQADYEHLDKYVNELEQTVVDNLEPGDLADTLNRVLGPGNEPADDPTGSN